MQPHGLHRALGVMSLATLLPNIYLPCLGWIALDGAVVVGALVYG